MKKIYLITILLSTTYCSTDKHLREERKSFDYANWDEKFKDRALCLCIVEGFENKKLESEIRKYDKSFYDPLAIAVFDPALKDIITQEIETIKTDSLESIDKYPADLHNALEGKRVMHRCLQLYKSKKLEKLTNQQKYYWKNIDTIVNEIHKVIPTF